MTHDEWLAEKRRLFGDLAKTTIGEFQAYMEWLKANPEPGRKGSVKLEYGEDIG